MVTHAPLSSTLGSDSAAELHLPSLLQQQRDYFNTEHTRSLEFRLTQLERLQQAIIDRHDDILAAVQADLGRPPFEAYFEISVLSEIKTALKHLKRWMRPRRVGGLKQLLSPAWIQPEPLGVVLIIGPWNYPFQLMLSPLVGAIAAGNCAILKPSEHAPHTAKVVTDLVRDTFDPNYVAVVPGDASVSQALLEHKFDHIFLTGGIEIGRRVMQAAACHLTPVTLELGGKSPCIVDRDTPLELTAKRIAWGKCINAGQTCIAPDYVLVQREIQPQLIEQLKQAIHSFFGDNPEASPDYSRIIHQRHFERLTRFLDNGQTVLGGQTNAETRYIAPTLLDGVTWDDPVMQEEIFGPILPILTYDTLDEAIAQINARPKPLALYLFSRDAAVQQKVLASTSSGGVCLNDTVMQVGVNDLPFGGVGDSGIGCYHGKASFDTFSHAKSVLKSPFWFELGWRFAPYTAKRSQQMRKVVVGR